MDLGELLETLVDYSNNCIVIKTNSLLNTIKSISYLRLDNISTTTDYVDVSTICGPVFSTITRAEIVITFVNTLDYRRYEINATQGSKGTCIINNITCNY